MTPEQQIEIENFRKRVTETRKELKELRKNLRQDAEALVFWTKVANIALDPPARGAAGARSVLPQAPQTASPCMNARVAGVLVVLLIALAAELCWYSSSKARGILLTAGARPAVVEGTAGFAGRRHLPFASRWKQLPSPGRTNAGQSPSAAAFRPMSRKCGVRRQGDRLKVGQMEPIGEKDRSRCCLMRAAVTAPGLRADRRRRASSSSRERSFSPMGSICPTLRAIALTTNSRTFSTSAGKPPRSRLSSVRPSGRW